MIASQIRGFGQVGASAAALNPRTFGDAAQRAVEIIPIFGQVLSAQIGVVRQFGDALEQTAQRLAPYSAQLSVAQAQAQVAQVLGDLRRARVLGDELADFTRARSRFSQSGQDLLARIIEPLIPTLTRMTDTMARIIEFLSKAEEKTRETREAVGNEVGKGIRRYIEMYVPGGRILSVLFAINERMEEIERNTRKPITGEEFLAPLLELRATERRREMPGAGPINLPAPGPLGGF